MPDTTKVTHGAAWNVYVGGSRAFTLTALCGREVSSADCQSWLGWSPTCPDCRLQDGMDGVSRQKGGYQRPMTIAEAIATHQEDK